jgi:acyl-ACP thioesterase
MNSGYPESVDGQQNEASHFERMNPVDYSLTHEQYLIIQHYLPKKYALIYHKHIKKGQVVTSAVKLGPEEV